MKFCADGRQSIDKISFAVVLIGMDIFGTLLKMSCSKSGLSTGVQFGTESSVYYCRNPHSIEEIEQELKKLD